MTPVGYFPSYIVLVLIRLCIIINTRQSLPKGPETSPNRQSIRNNWTNALINFLHCFLSRESREEKHKRRPLCFSHMLSWYLYYTVYSRNRRARRGSNLCYLICFINLIRFKAVTNRVYFLRKGLFSSMLWVDVMHEKWRCTNNL